MAFAAAISLKHTIQRLQIASQSSVHPTNLTGRKILDDAYNTVISLQQVLETSDISKNRTPRLHALDREIGQALCDLEDLFETHLSNHVLLTQCLESQPFGSTPLDLKSLEQGVRLFARSVKTMKKAYKKELNSKPLLEEDDSVCSVLGRPKKIVGFSEVLIGIKDELRVTRPWHKSRKVVTIVGMAGIGKTAVAKELYEDVSGEYDCCAWVNIGPKYVYREVMLSLLAQINPGGHDKMLPVGDRKIASFLCRSLKGRRYLIILDDVWDDVCSQLTSSFSEDQNGSRVLQTTRLHDVALFTSNHEIRLLGKEQSWELLCEKVFGDGEKCPPQLEKYGKMIAVNCEGLPLTIVTVGGMLSKAEKTLEYWKKVAEKKNSVFKDVYDEMSRILYPSYYYLPQYLKACFLYMGIFPEKIKIPSSKLIKLWSAEGFLQPNTSQTVENLASRCLAGLVSNSLVINPQKSSYSSYYFNEPVRIKTCALHSAFWHISTREAEKAKFLHILSSYGDGFGEGIKGQRRLSVGKNVLFGIKDVRNSIESVSTMHSLLCVGPPHMYPVPLFFGRLRLLRVVDALTVRFYCFPMEVSKLVHLRYLALNCDQEIPAGTMSKLRNLKSLIVGRSLCIKKSVGIDPLLPVEIWDMKELKHLQVTGFDLPAPPCDESLLPNLLTLSNVSIRSCTERILERIPKLKKLGIRIEWEPHATTVGSCCFRFEMSHLHKVESLKCVVVNPNLGCQLNLGCLHAARPLFDCYRSFSSHIQKLSLTGLGFPWREMSQIGRMDNLKVLKLRCFAFRGLKWETGRDAFPMLNFLLIEDCDLVEWKVGHNSFRYLRRLIIKHCYKLREFPGELFRVLLHSIEVVDCNSLLVASVMGLHKGKEEFFQLHISSSWNKKGPSVP